LTAAIFVVRHLSPNYVSALPQILSKNGALSAWHPEDGEKIQPGKIYAAPPDRHLLIEHDRVLVKKAGGKSLSAICRCPVPVGRLLLRTPGDLGRAFWRSG
jgi:chemotaxis response regulator CheB